MTAPSKTVHLLITDLLQHRFLRRDELIAAGVSTHQITAAVRGGRLIRVRRGIYTRPGVPDEVMAAVRVGGRLSCLSLLQMIGLFVQTNTRLHVQVPADLSRSRSRRPPSGVLHWDKHAANGWGHVAALGDAIRHAMRCQGPRATIATLDSVLHHGLLRREELVELFNSLPARFQPLLALVDGSAESGLETYMRLILRSLSLPFETQVLIPGVGRVDFLVAGWLIIECDSRQFHEGWDKQVVDRARDIAAARLGYVTIRPLASDLLGDRAGVRADVRAVVDAFSARLTPSRAPQLRKAAREAGAMARRAASLI